jgi:hypothetical protein
LQGEFIAGFTKDFSTPIVGFISEARGTKHFNFSAGYSYRTNYSGELSYKFSMRFSVNHLSFIYKHSTSGAPGTYNPTLVTVSILSPEEYDRSTLNYIKISETDGKVYAYVVENNPFVSDGANTAQYDEFNSLQIEMIKAAESIEPFDLSNY